MAVVSAKIADIEEQTVNWMKAVELGNSYSVRTGDMVLAVEVRPDMSIPSNRD